MIDDQILHDLLCLPEVDRPDGANLYARTMVGPGASDVCHELAESTILQSIAPEAGRLGHLRHTDRLFVLHATLIARAINDAYPDRNSTGWGNRQQ